MELIATQWFDIFNEKVSIGPFSSDILLALANREGAKQPWNEIYMEISCKDNMHGLILVEVWVPICYWHFDTCGPPSSGLTTYNFSGPVIFKTLRPSLFIPYLLLPSFPPLLLLVGLRMIYTPEEELRSGGAHVHLMYACTVEVYSIHTCMWLVKKKLVSSLIQDPWEDTPGCPEVLRAQRVGFLRRWSASVEISCSQFFQCERSRDLLRMTKVIRAALFSIL